MYVSTYVRTYVCMYVCMCENSLLAIHLILSKSISLPSNEY